MFQVSSSTNRPQATVDTLSIAPKELPGNPVRHLSMQVQKNHLPLHYTLWCND